MSKRLLIGPAGSGKTRRLMDDFEQALRADKNPLEENFFFILPSAEHTERVISLMLQRGIRGFFHRRVTTLPRLITEVFGVGREGIASNVTRFLLLKRILENKPRAFFKGLEQSSGFLHLMLNFLTELKESLVTPARFRSRMNALKKIEPDLSEKYETLAEVVEFYEKELTAQGLRDPQDAIQIYRARKRAGHVRPLRFRKIWLDGFFDFSNLQLDYLREMCALTDETVITLTQDGTPGREELFENVTRTADALKAMGFKMEYLERSQNSPAPALSHLERRVFSFGKSGKNPAVNGELMIFEAIGMEGEVEMIAREIERLYRTGEYKFSDFAVLLRQIGSYEAVLRSVFSRYEIPLEIHERERLQFSPLLGVVASLIRIFRDGWRRSDLMTFLKSTYVRKIGESAHTFEWAHELEHRAFREGVLAGRERWFARWNSQKDSPELEVFHTAKNEKLGILRDLEDALRAAADFKQIKRMLLRAALETFGIFQIEETLTDAVRRDAVAMKRFEALLDEMTRSSPGHSASSEFDAFADRFLLLIELDLYSLHERDKNRVQVYDVSLARQKEYRVVFLAGLLEKGFPVQIKEDAVLSDWERELFNADGDPAALKLRLPRQNNERYLFYLAVTRAREKIIFTYPRLDLEGKESLPSYYLDEVKSLFNEPLPERKQELAHPYPECRDALTPRELEIAVTGALWNPLDGGKTEKQLLYYLTNRLLENSASRSDLKRSFYEVRAELTDQKIREGGYFKASQTSATRLEDYARCPYKYFAGRVLQLKDPEEEINIRTKGTILHEILQRFFERRFKERDFVKKNSIARYVGEALRDELIRNPLIHEKNYQKELDLAELREFLEKFIEFECERLEASALQPRYFEYSFGSGPQPDAPPLEIDAAGRKVALTGKIDRVDVDPEEKRALVIDYKRSAHFERRNMELGIALQLPIYLTAVEKFLNLKPAGGELYSIKDRKKRGFYHAQNAEGVEAGGRSQQQLSEKEYRALIKKTFDFVDLFTGEMEAMQIPVKPRECSPYCPYSAVCRIEKWRLPFILDEIIEEDKRRDSAKVTK